MVFRFLCVCPCALVISLAITNVMYYKSDAASAPVHRWTLDLVVKNKRRRRRPKKTKMFESMSRWIALVLLIDLLSWRRASAWLQTTTLQQQPQLQQLLPTIFRRVTVGGSQLLKMARPPPPPQTTGFHNCRKAHPGSHLHKAHRDSWGCCRPLSHKVENANGHNPTKSLSSSSSSSSLSSSSITSSESLADVDDGHDDFRGNDEDDDRVVTEETQYQQEGDGALVNQTFTELYENILPNWLLQRCTELGWERPTRIQQQALNAILLGGYSSNSDDNNNDLDDDDEQQQKNDVIIQAETGEKRKQENPKRDVYRERAREKYKVCLL